MGNKSRKKAPPGAWDCHTHHERKIGTLTTTHNWYQTRKDGITLSPLYMPSPVWAMKRITSKMSSPQPSAKPVHNTSETRVWCPSIRHQDPTGPYELNIMMFRTNARSSFNVAPALWLSSPAPWATDYPPPPSPQQEQVPLKNRRDFPRLPKTGSWGNRTHKPQATGFSAHSTYIERKSWAEVASVPGNPDAPPSIARQLVVAVDDQAESSVAESSNPDMEQDHDHQEQFDDNKLKPFEFNHRGSRKARRQVVVPLPVRPAPAAPIGFSASTASENGSCLSFRDKMCFQYVHENCHCPITPGRIVIACGASTHGAPSA